jgi:tetratricopeptide (TPR) repeat protein
MSRRRLRLFLTGTVTAIAVIIYFWGDLCVWRAEANLAARQHAAAAKWIERSLWFGRKTNSRTCLLQLRIARRRGVYREVELQLRQAARLGVPTSEIRRERLLAMAQTGQFVAMQSNWPDLLQNPRDDGPEIARSYYTWSILNHNLALATKTLELWQKDYPHDPEPLELTGRFYQSVENWESAEEAYRRASALAPDNAEYPLLLANILQIRLKTKEAIPIYRAHLRKHPKNQFALRGLAQCEATNGDLKAAIRLLKEANDANPDDFETRKVYGETLLAAGDASAAVTVLETAFRTIPEHANLAYSLARALKACGRATEAEPLFAFVTESRPQLDLVINLEKQLQTEPGNLELRMKIASITAKYVSRRDAIQWYLNLLQVVPNYIPAHEALADLYQQLGEDKLAEFHAQQMRSDSPNFFSSTNSDASAESRTGNP